MDDKLADKFKALDELGCLETTQAQALRELAKVIEVLCVEDFHCVNKSSLDNSAPIKIEIKL